MMCSGAKTPWICAVLLVGCSFTSEGAGYPNDTDTADDATSGDDHDDGGTDGAGDDGGSDAGSGDGNAESDSADGEGSGGGDQDGGPDSGADDSGEGDSGGSDSDGDSGGEEDSGGADSAGDSSEEDGGSSDEEGDSGEDGEEEDGGDSGGEEDSGGEDDGDDGDDGDWTDECPQVAEPMTIGTLQNPTLTDVSGIAVSRRHDRLLWVHNDSPDGNLYALGMEGTSQGTFALDGATIRDLEDIAVGPGPQAGVSYIYLGDLGAQDDSGGANRGRTIYRFPEPELPSLPTMVTHISEFDALRFSYPSGSHEDSETLMVDPLTADLYIVRSGTDSNMGRPVLRFPFPQNPNTETALTFVTWVDVDGENITGGDISSRGDQIILRTGTSGGPDPEARIWLRAMDQTIADALEGEPCEVPVAAMEPKGEAICFGLESNAYITTSEAALSPTTPIYRYTYKR